MRMENFTRENGKMAKEKVKDCLNLKRVQLTKANGKMTKNGAWELKLILISLYTKELLEITREKGKESMCMRMEINTKAIGWMVSNTVAEDIYLKTLNTNTMETLYKIYLKVLEKRNFQTVINIKESIWQEKCMDMEYLSGKMEISTMANGLMDRNVDRVA